MRTILLILLLALLSFSGYAQTYNELVAQSFQYLEQNDTRKLKDVYPKLFAAYLKEMVPEYQQALTAAETGNKEQAFELLNKLVADSTLLREIQTDKHLSALRKDSRWKSLLQSINKIESGYNQPARQALLKIHANDQGIRLLVLEAHKKYGAESGEVKKVRSIMKRVDEESAAQVQKILDRYGWLGSNEVGGFANQTYFLAIQHVADVVVQQKYLPILRKAVKSGKAEPWHYAFLQDRTLMNQGKPQIYGTQKVTLSDDPKKRYIIPLQDPDHVDSLRAEVGLGPLKEDLEEAGMTWDVEEYKRRLPEIEKMYQERYQKQQAEKAKTQQ